MYRERTMDKDVENKLERLCSDYKLASATLESLRPPKLPSGKGQRRLEGRVVNVLGGLQEGRKPVVAALVRLAYVRGMREASPGSRLGEDQEKEVAFFENRLDVLLGTSEAQALLVFRNHMRRLRTAQAMEALKASPQLIGYVENTGRAYPLEQHARTSVRSVLEMATVAGGLAGTMAGSYDGVTNA